MDRTTVKRHVDEKNKEWQRSEGPKKFTESTFTEAACK